MTAKEMQRSPKETVVTLKGTSLAEKAPRLEMHEERTLYVAYRVAKVKVQCMCIPVTELTTPTTGIV